MRSASMSCPVDTRRPAVTRRLPVPKWGVCFFGSWAARLPRPALGELGRTNLPGLAGGAAQTRSRDERRRKRPTEQHRTSATFAVQTGDSRDFEAWRCPSVEQSDCHSTKLLLERKWLVFRRYLRHRTRGRWKDSPAGDFGLLRPMTWDLFCANGRGRLE
jgi:hypothetical protein